MNIKKILAMAAGLSLCICLASCGDTDSSTRDASSVSDNTTSTQQTDSTTDGGADSAADSKTDAQPEYDPNGDVRLFDNIKSQFEGNYKLTANLSVNGGEAYPVVYEVKGDLRYIGATISGMMSERFITADGELYNINHATTTYEKYGSDEIGNTIYKSPAYDPLFVATGAFEKAEVADGVISETYKLEFDTIEGTITYGFDSTTHELKTVKIDSADMDNESVTDIVLTAADDSDFEMPDISGYTRNN